MRLSIMKIMVLFLKHKCGKRDSSIVPSLFFSHFILFYFFLFPFFSLAFFWPFSLFFFFLSPKFHPDLWGNHSLHHPFLTWDNALIMITLLLIYNSTITTRYLEQNMTLYECLRRCTGICKESRVTCMKEL